MIHDARGFFPPSLQSADTHCFLDEEWCRLDSVLDRFSIINDIGLTSEVMDRSANTRFNKLTLNVYF